MYNLFFISELTLLMDADDKPFYGYAIGGKHIRPQRVKILGSHNGKDLIHYVTDHTATAKAARNVSEFIGDSYIEIMLKSLLGVLPTLIAKKCMMVKYVLGEDSKIATVEQWELDGSPEILKVLKPHRFLGVDVD